MVRKRVSRPDYVQLRAEASSVSQEEAERCPICQVPGTKVGEKSIPLHLGSKWIVMECRNTRCRWGRDPTTARYGYQIRPDGTIPVRKSGPKQWPKLPNMSQEAYDHAMERLAEEHKLELRQGGSSGGEVDKDSGRIRKTEEIDRKRQDELRLGDGW